MRASVIKANESRCPLPLSEPFRWEKKREGEKRERERGKMKNKRYIPIFFVVCPIKSEADWINNRQNFPNDQQLLRLTFANVSPELVD